jgi:hypothetical protein
MSDKRTDDYVQEFANLDTATRRKELAAAGASSKQKLDALTKSLKLPNLVDIDTQVSSIIVELPHGCAERLDVLGLSVGPNQRLLKRVSEQWSDGEHCYRNIFTFGMQFMGYGAYCLSFEKDTGNTNLFANFFRDIAAYDVNLHRTFVFTIETYENPNASQITRLLLPGDGHTTGPDPNYLANLERLVVAAKARGIVVQVCLFVHQSVVGAPGTAAPPAPVVLTGSAHERYKSFFNTASQFLPMQGKLIDGIVTKLLPHWNVVYEIGNELRVPQPQPAYNETHLKAWIDWAAARIRAKDISHLITTSTGSDNDAPINQLSRIQFCSFHQGQWTANLDATCDRAKAAGDKHVVFDDDGAARPLAKVKEWARTVLNTRGGCRASFNHKGFSPTGAYNPNWVNGPAGPPTPEGKPSEQLTALRDGRATSTSPCARS